MYQVGASLPPLPPPYIYPPICTHAYTHSIHGHAPPLVEGRRGGAGEGGGRNVPTGDTRNWSRGPGEGGGRYPPLRVLIKSLV